MGRRCTGRKHIRAIDSDRLREHDYFASLCFPSFPGWRTNPFRAHGSEPKGSLEDNHGHSYVNRFSVLFMVRQSVRYEDYCYSLDDHNSYRRWKYATFTSFGWFGLLAFVVGFLWLTCNLFKIGRSVCHKKGCEQL